MVGHVDYCFFVGCCLHHDVNRVVWQNGEHCLGVNLSGESVVTIGADQSQYQCSVVQLVGIIYLVHPSCVATAMQAMLGTVARIVLT